MLNRSPLQIFGAKFFHMIASEIEFEILEKMI